MPSIDNSLSSSLSRLSGDKLFLTALLVAPIFWGGLYQSGTSVSGPQWLIKHPWLFIRLALLYPLLEEWVFRGLLQERLWQTRLSKMSMYCLSMPNVVSSLLFTTFHFLNHPPGWALVVIIPSLVFGFFRDRYQHVLPAMILHIFYNSGYFLLFGN